MAGKGLGAGLGALLGDAALENESGAAEYLPLARIEPRAGQPRTEFDDEALQELSDSIREHGIIQPIIVRSMGDGYYQIIAGERRWRAARLAGLREAPVRIIDADDRKASEIALVENLQREDLNPVEEALGYRSLARQYSLTQEEISQRVGKSRPVIANALRLLNLPEEVLELVKDGTLSMSIARAILELEKPEDQRYAAKKIADGGLTVREATALIKRIAAGISEEKPQKPAKDPYVADVEARLGRALGTKVQLNPGKRKGTIVLDYYSPEDLERLLGLLGGNEN
ncbi:MAG: ParB/RepB/Spo0J family partition protein [Oscillospiraceae bacterium]|nr:ParB/RepB/Spo0J family partition protein [Oscillospiraceae bacterium]